MLALPYEFLQRLETPLPSQIRGVAGVPKNRLQKWLDLADAIANRGPTESSQRTVRFLIALATEPMETDVGRLPSLRWLTQEETIPVIDMSAPSALGTFCPAMRFKATLR